MQVGPSQLHRPVVTFVTKSAMVVLTFQGHALEAFGIVDVSVTANMDNQLV